MRSLALSLAAISILVACGGADGATGSSGDPGLRVVASPGGTDTVLARPAQPLVLEVRPGRAALDGVVLTIESFVDTTDVFSRQPVVFFSKPGQGQLSTRITDTTDASGRVSVLLRNGSTAGTARVIVSSAALGLTRTIEFTLRPGAPARAVVTSADTVVLTGNAVTVAGYVADSYGNRVADPPTFSAGVNTASVDAMGRAVAGQSTGRAFVVLHGGAGVDTARYTVMPMGSMVSLHVPDVGIGSLATSNFDGSDLKLLAPAQSPAYPSWSPISDQVVYHQYETGFGNPALYTWDAKGGRRHLLSDGAMGYAAFPRMSPDGQSVVFVGGVDSIRGPTLLWRVAKDGGPIQAIPSSGVSYWIDTQPSMSANGAWLVFPRDNNVVQMILATGQQTEFQGRGAFPTYSPDGRRLAYIIDFSVAVRDVLSGETKVFPLQLNPTDKGLTWLPGSQWLLTRGQAAPLLVNASTGETIPLPSMRAFRQMQLRQ